MKTAYNVKKLVLAEPSLKRNIVPDAKRIKNFAPLPWRTQPDSLRGHLPDPSVLQETEIEMAFAKTGSLLSTFHLFSARGFNSRYHLCFDRWYSSTKQNKNPSGQWCVSTNHRVKEVSLRQQLKTFPETRGPNSHPEHQQGPRPIEAEDVLSSQASHQSSVRFRFFRSHPLWQVHRGSRSRLQSSQKRGSFLPSFTLFRISFQRLLAWYLEAWKRLYLLRRPGVSKRMFDENSARNLLDSSLSRLRILRPQIYRAPGSRGDWLCHCGQDDQAHQKQNRKSSLSQLQEGLGCSRIFLPTVPLGEAPSLCSHSSSPPRERHRPTYPLCPKTLCLSSLCNQSSLTTRKDLVFLSTSSRYRNHHQRVERKLCFGQNSYQQFSSQPPLFSPFIAGLQYRQLVQKALLATKISGCYLRDDSNRILGIASQIGQNRPPEYTQITCRVYLQTNPRPYHPEYQKDGAIINFDHLANFFRNGYT